MDTYTIRISISRQTYGQNPEGPRGEMVYSEDPEQLSLDKITFTPAELLRDSVRNKRPANECIEVLLEKKIDAIIDTFIKDITSRK
jgi:hypothetical protein